ncbi:MAG TPA: hypothetical protein VM577_11585 [Anaerovoracaceae bacterium]|nr:hypothetical protein [Anaerovoracaceae bacterium]
MSTKKLDKTAIEGGRINGYKYERKQSLRSARRGVKQVLQSIRDYEDVCEVEFPEREKSTYWDGEKFKDKLSPVYRWIETRVGLPWDETHSLMRKRFDARTTPGRHILFDHMLNQIWTSQDHTTLQSEYREYYVDGYGILRKNEDYRNRYGYSSEWKKAHAERPSLGPWLQGRLVDKIGEVLYWFEPVRTVPNPLFFRWDHNGIEFLYDVEFDQYGRMSGKRFYTPYRQGKRLDGKDVEFFSKLHPHNKEALLRFSPLKFDYRGSWGLYGPWQWW